MSTKGINFPKTRLGMAKMNKLTEAAEGLFTTKGFYDTSIVDICKMADTAVGTFYIYFETKTDVYRFLLDKYKREIEGMMKEAICGYSDPTERRRESVRLLTRYVAHHKSAYSIILGSLSVDKDMFFDCLSSLTDTYLHHLVEDHADASAIAYSLMGIAGMLGLKAISEEMSDEDIDKMIDQAAIPGLLT